MYPTRRGGLLEERLRRKFVARNQPFAIIASLIRRDGGFAMPQLFHSLREAPICRCELCGGQMKYLGKQTEHGADVRLFRCYECCLVTTETFDTLARA